MIKQSDDFIFKVKKQKERNVRSTVAMVLKG